MLWNRYLGLKINCLQQVFGSIAILLLSGCAQPAAPLIRGADGEVSQITTPASTSTPSSPPSQQLDLSEAHILEVSVTPLSEAEYRFDVTMIHDDDGEAPSFADWWQVEDLEGTILGTRILAHAHGSLPFTRSAVIGIPPGTNNVIVRGHDMLHGFGGQAMRIDLITRSQSPLPPSP